MCFPFLNQFQFHFLLGASDETFTFAPELASYSFNCACKSVGRALKVAPHMSTAWMMLEVQRGSGQERQGERAVTWKLALCLSGSWANRSAKPQIWRRKDLLARLPRVRRTGDLSQSHVSLKSKTGEVFSWGCLCNNKGAWAENSHRIGVKVHRIQALVDRGQEGQRHHSVLHLVGVLVPAELEDCIRLWLVSLKEELGL